MPAPRTGQGPPVRTAASGTEKCSWAGGGARGGMGQWCGYLELLGAWCGEWGWGATEGSRDGNQMWTCWETQSIFTVEQRVSAITIFLTYVLVSLSNTQKEVFLYFIKWRKGKSTDKPKEERVLHSPITQGSSPWTF